MSFTYDLALTSNVHKVRNLIDDTDSTSYQLEDEEITSFLTMTSNDLYLTAALCLRRIAASKALVAKRIKAGDYEEDVRDYVKGILEAAKIFEKMAVSVPEEAVSQEILTDFNYRDILRNEALRGEETY